MTTAEVTIGVAKVVIGVRAMVWHCVSHLQG